MKKFIMSFFFIAVLLNAQLNAQDFNVDLIGIDNSVGRITWLFADSEISSVNCFNFFKEFYNDDNFYEYELNNPTEFEQVFIVLFTMLCEDFYNCYYDPQEINTIAIGDIDNVKITDYQLYILRIRYAIDSRDIDFIFIHNTVNDEQVLYCNIKAPE